MNQNVHVLIQLHYLHALFTGQYVPSTSVTDYGDFRDVRLFSKLNIPTEYLSLNKDLNIIYRVYTS